MRSRFEAFPQSPGRLRHWGPFRQTALATILALLVLAGGWAGSASAENSPARKLGRGVANLSLGLMAIPSEVIDTTKESGPALGVTWGFLKGTAMMVVTESVGLWEVVTCPFATPPDYVPILSPEFPWQRFTARTNQPRKRKVRTGTGGGRRVRE